MAVTKKIENSYKKEAFRETWNEAKSPRQVNWTPTCQPQIHKPNPYFVEEEEEEFVDGERQESDFVDEEFEHEGVEDEDPSQGFVDWDTPPVYNDDVNEEDDQLEDEEPTNGIADEDDQLEDEEPMDDIANYEEDDIADYKEVEYVDFLGVEDILNSPNNDVDEFYTDKENYMFIREVTADPFMSLFMARGREKEREKYGKSKELTSGV
jgi:hypothetical protein